MKRLPLAVGLATAATIALVLSACAPAVHPSSAPTTHPEHSVTPHPKHTQAAVPAVRVPIKCASLLTDSAVAAVIGSSVKHRRDETTPAVDITEIVARQYGSLDCLWGGDPQDSGYDQYLSIDITPDAAAGFTANLSGFSNQDPPVTVNTAGDKSVSGCTVEGDVHCSANMLVGSYWVTAYIQNLGAASVTQTAANTSIQSVLTTTAAALKNAKAAPAWIPPGAALPTFCSSDASTAAVNTALGVTDFARTGEDEAEADAASYTQLPDVYSQCTWGSGASSEAFTYLSVALLKGGAWVLPQLPGEQNSKSYMLGPYATMSIPGATAAAGNCSVDADECEVAVSIGSVLAVIQTDDTNDAVTQTALAKVVAAIKAS